MRVFYTNNFYITSTFLGGTTRRRSLNTRLVPWDFSPLARRTPWVRQLSEYQLKLGSLSMHKSSCTSLQPWCFWLSQSCPHFLLCLQSKICLQHMLSLMVSLTMTRKSPLLDYSFVGGVCHHPLSMSCTAHHLIRLSSALRISSLHSEFWMCPIGTPIHPTAIQLPWPALPLLVNKLYWLFNIEMKSFVTPVKVSLSQMINAWKMQSHMRSLLWKLKLAAVERWSEENLRW